MSDVDANSNPFGRERRYDTKVGVSVRGLDNLESWRQVSYAH